MSDSTHRCRWCFARFPDATSTEEHENIHRALDFFNDNESETQTQPPSAKKQKIDDDQENYFSDSFLDELMNFQPNHPPQSGRGPNSPPAAAAATRAPDSPVPGPSNVRDSPIPGPSNARDSPIPGPSHSRTSRESNSILDFTIKQVGQRTFQNNVVDRHYRVDPKSNPNLQGQKLSDLYVNLENMFDDIIDFVREDLEGSDLGRVVIHHGNLETPIIVSLRPLNRLNGRSVLSQIENVLQSHQNLDLNDSFHVDLGTMELPKGGKGDHGLHINCLWGTGSSVSRKRSIVEIFNTDLTCLARAILMGYLAANRIPTSEWKEMHLDESIPIEKHVLDTGKCPRWYFDDLKRSRNGHRQTNLTLELCRRAGVPTNRQMTLNDITPFEDLLNIDVLVVGSRAGNKFVRVPSDQGVEGETVVMTGRQRVYLYLVEKNSFSHYHAIINICGFFANTFFCERCLKPYRDKHQCASTCFVCKRRGDCVVDKDCQMSCRSCHMTCRSRDCFDTHRTVRYGRESPCQLFWKCCTCKKVLSTRKRNPDRHVCGEWHCRSCKRYVDQNHLCYLRSIECKESDIKFIFFDFECTQEDDIIQCSEGYNYERDTHCKVCKHESSPCKNCTLCIRCRKSSCGKYRHVPNLVVAHKMCSECVDVEFEPGTKCNNCGTRCSKCKKYDKVERCFEKNPCVDTCGFREIVFRGEDTKEKFGRWLFDDQNKNYTAIAHNLKGYDSYFILEYLVNNSIRPENIIYCGSKIMYLYIARGLQIRLIDSLNFLPMPLANFPAAFGLQELKKGFFPHFFNSSKNQSYRGPYPLPEMYGYNTMRDNVRKEFLTWYEEKTKNNDIFDFTKELLEYCRSDVDILRQACLKFRHLLMEITGQNDREMNDDGTIEERLCGGIDPFQSTTIASVCMKVFKAKFLQETWNVQLRRGDEIRGKLPAVRQDGKLSVIIDDKLLNGDTLQRLDYVIEDSQFISSPIAQVPSYGYAVKDTYSLVSIQWLEWLMEVSKRTNSPKFIAHALNSGEVNLPGTRYRLDGYCTETNTAYEFHGCFWHGCPVCYETQRGVLKNPRTGQSMEELYALTCKKRQYVKSLGINYVQIWEHEFRVLIEINEEASRFVKSLDLQERLNPRDSFFGGRTNATKLYYKTREGEQIHYLDFCSLYPSINKYAEYPIKEPRIVTNNFDDIRNYFGIAKIKILPPRKLYHPVLPVKINNKLVFSLCRTCAETKSQERCVCSDEDRCIIGTWCTPEIFKALDCGYTLQNIYEVYHWEEKDRYDPLSGNGGLFKEYINLFLKIKQEASGWPDWVQTDEDKLDFLRQYETKEGIRLDPQIVKRNPALRSIAKLLLNSFWGKFGQRLNMPQCNFFHESEADKFFRCLSDPSKTVKDFFIVSDDMIQLSWENKAETVKEDFNTNVFIATFTTCWARLKLYNVLEMLQERVLYFDTDSVIFISRPGDVDPEVGSFLGELTSELNPGDHITEFVSGGPKNYAYRTVKGQEVCKVKGFTLNYANSQILNFESLLNLVTSQNGKEQPLSDKISIVNDRKIAREKWHRVIYNREETKDYKIVYDKRVIQRDEQETLPYGY